MKKWQLHNQAGVVKTSAKLSTDEKKIDVPTARYKLL